MDSRDDDPNVDGIRQLDGGDDEDTSVEGLALVSSWCSVSTERSVNRVMQLL